MQRQYIKKERPFRPKTKAVSSHSTPKEEALIQKHTNQAPALILPVQRLRHSNEIAAVGQNPPSQ